MTGKSITDNQKTILALMEKDCRITISTISATMGINHSAIQKQIEHLKDAEILKREGGKVFRKMGGDLVIHVKNYCVDVLNQFIAESNKLSELN